MTDEAIELMLASDEAVAVTHYPPGGAGVAIGNGIFGEAADDASEFRETREGNQRGRTAKLVIRTSVTVTLGNEPSRFLIRNEVWKAVSTAPERGVQTVRLERLTQSTQRRQGVQHHQ